MEVIFNIANFKSLILFLHITGLALGVGGSWVLDSFIIKNRSVIISKEKYQIIEFVSRLVIIGLILLWVSGLLFLLYYFLYTPLYLSNQKVWGKLFIVMVLTINGYFIHSIVIPKIKGIIGSTLISSFTKKEMLQLTLIAVISFLSWLFPIIIGVTSSLNFNITALEIILFYLAFVLVVALLAFVVCIKICSFTSAHKAFQE